MDIHLFRMQDSMLRAKRSKPFLLIVPDPPASAESIAVVERATGVKLPETYKAFLAEFGGGSYGLTNVCSAHPASEFYLPERQAEFVKYAPQELLPVSDDFAGGMYVLRVEDGVAGENVLYWHVDGGLRRTPFQNVLEFIAQNA